MKKTTTKKHFGGYFLVMLICFGLFAGSCEAESLSIREILVDASNYSDRQVQVEGRVERWIELGSAEKTGLYVLKDNYGDMLQIKTMEAIPPVGENITVKGLVIFDSKKNEYYLQSLNILNASNPKVESHEKSSGYRSSFFTKLIPGYGTAMKLLALAAVAMIVLLFIVVIAVRVKKGKNKVFDVPDFSFDGTRTIKIDVNGQFVGSEENSEGTLMLMPGHFKITKGPKELEGQLYRPASVLTKVGREEASVNKSSGWITFPPNFTTISRYQADLVFKDGVYFVENKSRSSVTKVNGVPLTYDKPYRLSNKDIIAFSEIELT